MKIERDAKGDFLVDSAEIAGRFGLPEEDFRKRMQHGLVKSTVEIGEGEDAGTCRLSLRLGNRVWRAILDGEDRVIREGVSFVRGELLRRPEAGEQA